MGGGAGGGTPTCSPACSDWQECSGTTCFPRYSGIVLNAPPRTNTSFTVTGALQLAPGRTPFPGAPLTITATRDAAPASAAIATFDGGTFFSTPFPATEGAWLVTVSAWADAGAGLSASSSTLVDTTPPSFVVTIDPPPVRRIGDGGAPSEVDPGMPNGFRRDERATLHLSTSATDLNAASLRVAIGDAVLMIDGGGPANPITPTDGGFDVSVSLWAPTLNAYRGTFPITVSASDDLGNSQTSDGGTIPVTRFRWARPSTGQPPVVDSEGNIFRASGQQIEAVSREGSPLWSRTAAGIPLRIALGTVKTTDGALLYALEQVSDGGTAVLGEAFPTGRPAAPVRVWQAPGTRLAATGPVVLSDVANSHEGVFVAYVDGATSRTAMQWSDITTGTLQTQTRVPSIAIASVGWLGSFVGRGRDLFVAGDNRIFGFTTATNLGTPEESSLGYPGTLTGFSNSYGDLAVEGMGTLNNLIGVAMTGPTSRLFRMTYPTAPLITTPSTVHSMSAPLVAGGTVWFVQGEFLGGQFLGRICRATLGSAATCSSNNAESVYATPILTADGRLLTSAYRANTTWIQERDRTTLDVIWEGPGPRILAGVVCGQLQGTGIALGGDDYTLSSIVIDARGIDAAADWPMPTHDPQGTRSHSQDLTRFRCP